MKTLYSIIIFITGICFISTSLFSTTFYVDPVNGNMSNDGSINSPWSTIQEVLDNNSIESYSYTPLPYDPVNSQLSIRNSGAPVMSGDTLLLMSGLHGQIVLRGYYNLDYITIMAGQNETPIINYVKITSCRKWKIIGLNILSHAYAENPIGRLVFIESHNWHGPSSLIEVHNCTLKSAESPWTTADEWLQGANSGIFIKADSVIVTNNLLNTVDMGITASGNHIQAIDNEIANFSGDGMRMLGSNITFEGNTIKNCYNVDENHDDGIQSFSTGGIILNNNIIRSNTILNYEDPNQPLLGPLQGIGCFDGPFNNWIVENNLVVVNHWHGISLYGANDCTIINNTVLDPTPVSDIGPSWIRINDGKDGTPSTNCIIKNNVSNTLSISDGISTHNTLLSNLSEYDLNFVNTANTDFHLLESSYLIDAADSNYATSSDIEGTPRTHGNAPDIGAYEYKITTSNIEQVNSTKLLIYPNPASDFINILINNPSNDEAILTIRDDLGRIILTRKMNTVTSISTSNPAFISGSNYFITVLIGDKTSTKKVFIAR